MAATPPANQPEFDIHADQGGLILVTMIMLISVSTVFVLLRLLSRRVAGAGYWVRIVSKPILHVADIDYCSGTISW